MKTITAKFNGTFTNLDMFLTCGIRYNSTKKFVNKNTLVVTWICEETNYEKALEECMDCVNIIEMEMWNVDLNYIN